MKNILLTILSIILIMFLISFMLPMPHGGSVGEAIIVILFH
ncbi:secreted protein [Beggiatoa sp. PS]|nr:secreted protein [Beggiatoa sp. PS]